MIKAYIIIELENGRSIKYVRDVVTDNDGDSEAYYGYGDTAGDSFGSQGGDSGKVGYDFEDIVSNSTGDSWLLFPESAGDTYILARRNASLPGDTESLLCKVRTKVLTDAISDIYILEETAPAITLIG